MIEHESDPPNPLEGYLRCLHEPPAGCTHLLVVQDDTVVCRNFEQALPLVARDVPVCLFMNGYANIRTRKVAYRVMIAGGHWVELVHSDIILPTVAVLWPVEQAAAFLDWWAVEPRRRKPDRSDDGVLGRWMKKRARKVLATLPSLVEHPDDSHSFVWDKVKGNRHALWYIGDDDPLAIDWAV